MAKSIPCAVIVNSPSTGHIFPVQECKSISAGLKYARAMDMPYRLYTDYEVAENGRSLTKGKLVRRGWLRGNWLY